MRVPGASRILVFAALAAGLTIYSLAQQPATIADQLSTPERIRKHTWWPLNGAGPREDYVGSATCVQCHASIVATQSQSAMANTAIRAEDSTLLKQHAAELKFALGPYRYRITTGESAQYLVENGTDSFSVPLGWGFGTGKMGQSYLFDHDGKTYMVPFSYYGDAKLWDFTVDIPHNVPASTQKAIGLELSSDQRSGCYECHGTAAITSGKLDTEKAIPDVTCEACHGPGANHVAAAKSGLADQGTTLTFNPRGLNPVESVDFCGACHRTWWDVILQDSRGTKSVRFPAYRLQNSRCWGKGDPRITCVACHDPHQPLVTDASYYDSKCLSCHTVKNAKPLADHPGVACPVAVKECTNCHMPKSEAAFVHSRMTDHMIRVVRPGEKMPV